MTFLFTDIEGSTTLLRQLGEDVYALLLNQHHELIRSALAAHGGTELTMTGDGFFAAFTSPRGAVAAVVSMQRDIESQSWPGGERIRVRMGVHTGEAERTAAGPVGLDVHRAARIAAVAHGGQVLLSETAATLVRDALPADAELRDLGVHRLRDLGRPERIFQLTAAGLQPEFPPLRSLGNPALLNNLPAELSTFVGRDAELKDVRSLLESARLVTLTGAGGSGKSRLALQAAAELLDATGDGVWLAELAAVTEAESVPSSIASVLGIAAQQGRPVLDTLVDALEPQRLLIVLDNCEHLIDACARTADALLRHCPRVYLLATSREPLGINGEVVYRVPPLSLPANDDPGSAGLSDAVVLFVDRARNHGVDLTVDALTGPLIASICRRLDGMPLAIELAAARLRSLSLADLRDRLDHRFRLLTGGSRAALARQQTLLATVDWSYSLLSAAEQRLLNRLSVFPESFDLAGAEATCAFGGVDRLDVVDLLGSLVNKSLVLTEQGPEHLRYRLLETIRQFALEHLVDAGEDEATRASAAHCGHFLSVAETAAPHLTGPDQGAWFARLDADRANLWRAVEYAASAPGATGLVLRFAVALQRYWMSRSTREEAGDLVRPVLQRPEARSDPRLFVEASMVAADKMRTIGAEAAVRAGEQVVGLARELGEPRLLAESLAGQCGILYFAGEPERGAPLGAEAVELARQVGDDVLLGTSMMGYLLCRDVTHPADAERLYAEAIAYTRRSGDRMTAHVLHNNASVHAIRAGDFATARAHLVEAAKAAADIGEENQVMQVNLGWVQRYERQLDAAHATFEAALRVSRRIGDRYCMAYSAVGLACISGDLGSLEQAARLHGIAATFQDRAGGPWQEPEARYRLDSMDALRQRLGGAQFDQAYADGKELTFDDAIELALAPSAEAAA